MTQVLCHLPTFQDPNLLVDYSNSDDAAVYRINDTTAIIQSVDFFPPVVDDPYDYGAIAAANALSDIYAMGGTPKLAMNLLCIPEDFDPSITEAILRGGYDKIKEADALICGGHTIKDPEPKYGLSVTGFAHPDRILKNLGLQEGDALILTKPIGTGIVNTAAKVDLISEEDERCAINSMATLNRVACEIMLKYDVHAATDITGFGLLGHAYEMAKGSELTLQIDSTRVPILPSALDMASMGIIPKGAYGNRRWLDCRVEIDQTIPLNLADVLFDPQTSGGLLFALPPDESEDCLAELTGKVPACGIIGEVGPPKLDQKKRIYVR